MYDAIEKDKVEQRREVAIEEVDDDYRGEMIV